MARPMKRWADGREEIDFKKHRIEVSGYMNIPFLIVEILCFIKKITEFSKRGYR